MRREREKAEILRVSPICGVVDTCVTFGPGTSSGLYWFLHDARYQRNMAESHQRLRDSSMKNNFCFRDVLMFHIVSGRYPASVVHPRGKYEALVITAR